jgi:polysaccharide chain length determinant protein (PEP-CTERM system associated)
MTEVEEKPSQGISVEQLLGIVRRRRWYFLIPFFFGWLLVWAASWVLPPQYKSSTLILVEQPTMPKDYVMPNVNDDIQERIQGIQQEILSRTRLLHIIDQLNLYAQDRKGMTPDDVVERMRKDIEVTLMHDEAKRQVVSFSVAFTARDPHVAQQVTSELTNLFISQNLEVRQQESEDTTKFLESQLEDARKNLADQEEKVREFKTAHPGELPTQLQSNLQILSGLQTQLQSEQDQLNAARQQNAYLQSMMAQYKAYPKAAKSADGTPTGLAQLDLELEKEKAELADLLSRYTDRHPDVRKVKDQIEQTEKSRAQLAAQLKVGAASNGAGTKSDDVDPSESAPMIQVQGQLKANQAEIANRERSVAGLEAKINQYQANLSQEPAVEQQYIDLTRGYDQSKTSYDSLLNKKNESQMATSMELRQQGEHFQMIDPPSLPLKPDFPNRMKLCMMGLGVGIVLGGALAGAMEFLDGRLYSEKAIKALLMESPVLAEIPSMISPEEQKRSLRQDQFAWLAAGLTFVAILLGSAVSYLRG